MRAMNGVMPMPPPIQICRGRSSSKVKQPYGEQAAELDHRTAKLEESRGE
jgi:hypothetical protein